MKQAIFDELPHPVTPHPNKVCQKDMLSTKELYLVGSRTGPILQWHRYVEHHSLQSETGPTPDIIPEHPQNNVVSSGLGSQAACELNRWWNACNNNSLGYSVTSNPDWCFSLYFFN